MRQGGERVETSDRKKFHIFSLSEKETWQWIEFQLDEFSFFLHSLVPHISRKLIPPSPSPPPHCATVAKRKTSADFLSTQYDEYERKIEIGRIIDRETDRALEREVQGHWNSQMWGFSLSIKLFLSFFYFGFKTALRDYRRCNNWFSLLTEVCTREANETETLSTNTIYQLQRHDTGSNVARGSNADFILCYVCYCVPKKNRSDEAPLLLLGR